MLYEVITKDHVIQGSGEAAELLHKPLHPLLPSFQVFEGAFHHLVILDEFTHLFKGGTGTHGYPLNA